MLRCMNCGEPLRWNSNFNTKEIYGEDEPEGITSIGTCGKCGFDYEITVYDEHEEIKVMIYIDEE